MVSLLWTLSTQTQINDCIQNTTVLCNPRQNSVQDKTQSKTKFIPRQNWKKNFIRKKLLPEKKILRFFLRLNFILDIVLD